MRDRERLLQLEEDRRQTDARFRREEAEAARQWESEESRKNREFQQKMMASRTRKDILVFGVIVTALIVAATILGAFIERGFWWEGRSPVTMPSSLDTLDSQTESISESSP